MANDVLFLAEFMHSNYEYFAHKNFWETQKRCQTEFSELPEENKKTMTDLAKHLIDTFKIDVDIAKVEEVKKRNA